jgi:hypothetical protein
MEIFLKCAFLLTCIAVILVTFRAVQSGRKAKLLKVPMRQTSLKVAIFELKTAKKSIGDDSAMIFVELLTIAIKNYLSAEFKYVNDAKTNGEIVEMFTKDIANDWETSGLLAEIFSISDEIKFAARKLSLRQQRGIYKKAWLFVLRVSRVNGRVG